MSEGEIFFQNSPSLSHSKNLITMDYNRPRYSDEDLQEFREIIENKIALAKRDYEDIMDSIKNPHGNDVVDTMPTYKALEEGSASQSQEDLQIAAARQLKFIQGLEAALVRIDNKTYGVCRVTGKLIPKERLRAVPHATLSIEAKQQQGK